MILYLRPLYQLYTWHDTHSTNGLPQPLRFLARFFTTLFDPLCGDVAVATAERVSPFPATAGKLTIQFQESSTVQRGIKTYPAFTSPLCRTFLTRA